MAQGKHADACPKLEESQRLDPGIGTQFNLAVCYEQVGRTASAWSTFLDVAGAARAAGQTEREKVARQRATALEPRLIRLTITAPVPSLRSSATTSTPICQSSGASMLAPATPTRRDPRQAATASMSRRG